MSELSSDSMPDRINSSILFRHLLCVLSCYLAFCGAVSNAHNIEDLFYTSPLSTTIVLVWISVLASGIRGILKEDSEKATDLQYLDEMIYLVGSAVVTLALAQTIFMETAVSGAVAFPIFVIMGSVACLGNGKDLIAELKRQETNKEDSFVEDIKKDMNLFIK